MTATTAATTTTAKTTARRQLRRQKRRKRCEIQAERSHTHTERLNVHIGQGQNSVDTSAAMENHWRTIAAKIPRMPASTSKESRTQTLEKIVSRELLSKRVGTTILAGIKDEQTASQVKSTTTVYKPSPNRYN